MQQAELHHTRLSAVICSAVQLAHATQRNPSGIYKGMLPPPGILVDGAVLEFFSLAGRAAAKGFHYAPVENNDVRLFSSDTPMSAMAAVYGMGCGWTDDIGHGAA